MSIDMAIIGLGYVGLPLAQQASRSGLSVVGFDVNSAMVDSLNNGTSHIDDLTDADIAEMLSLGFTATTDEKALADADAIVICVPTPLSVDGEPDLGAVIAATTTISRQLRREHLVVLESTTYPGTTDEVVRPDPREGGPDRGQRLPPGLQPRACRPGQPDVRHRQHAQGRRRPHPGVDRGRDRVLQPVHRHRRAVQGHA